MNDISTLFVAIGEFFTRAAWYSMIKWPFWILLCTVAVGGVYCARFGKKALLNRGISGVLSLVLIYLTATLCYVHFPLLRTFLPALPFLSVTEQTIALVDPFTLSVDGLAPLLLRLMLLILLVNLSDTFGAGGKTLLRWFFSQILTVAIGLLFYSVVTAGLALILPGILNRYAIIPVGIVVVLGVLMLCAKFVFTVLIRGGNPYFTAVHKFFTVNKGGALFTTSALSFLLSMVVLTAMHMSGNAIMTFVNVNTTGLWIILLLLLIVLYIFCMFYNDRTKS